MIVSSGSYFHLHMVSDSTGETLITVARAVAAQYANVTPIEHVYPLVRSQKQLDRVLTEIEESPGIVLFTLLDDELVDRLQKKCAEINVPSLSIIGPVLQLFQAYLGAETSHRVGAQHVLNAEYFKRIDALNYTMMHDDGQHTDGLEEADVVLVGVSRTSKTPTSIYLANRGVRTANIPLVPNIPVPPELTTLTQPLIVSLHATARNGDPGAAEPAARPWRPASMRILHRQAVGDRRGAVRAQAERAAWLGAARCDAPLDRGDRSRHHEAAVRPATAAERAMTLWLGDKPLILASQSKSRQALLQAAGIPILKPIPADIDERGVQAASGLKDPAAIAALLAKIESAACGAAAAGPRRGRCRSDACVGRSGFSASRPGASRRAGQLRALAGKTHELHSAIAVAKGDEVLFEHVSVARMTMRGMSDATIARYLDAAGAAVTTSVGAYQLEGLGVHLFETIEGDHFTILGLPLLPLLGCLRGLGLVAE